MINSIPDKQTTRFLLIKAKINLIIKGENDIQQLTLFENEEVSRVGNQIFPFQIKDKVIVINQYSTDDVENYYYLEKLHKKTGIVKQVFNKAQLHYLVEIKGQELLIYHHELQKS